jgi:3-deoxy-D-manno-octulosonate 8-phosphate phosphatase (KDO 8-P phosphatase)
MTSPPRPQEIEERARKIVALICDVDGVLTDGRVTYLADGTEFKSFSMRDGLGLQLMKVAECRVAFISGRASDAVVRRGEELGVDAMLLGIDDKSAAFDDLLARFEISDDQVAYVGDDLPDLPLLRRAGLSFAVADAAPEVRSAAHVVLRTNGGQGAVREACERILKAKGAWRVE